MVRSDTSDQHRILRTSILSVKHLLVIVIHNLFFSLQTLQNVINFHTFRTCITSNVRKIVY